MVTSMPSPPNSPLVSTCMSPKLLAFMKLECGSSPLSMPLTAPSTIFLTSGSST